MPDIFHALADPSRRALLDRLHERGGQSLRELCDGLPMSRQAVAKHINILENAELISVRRSGRNKLHYLNPVPLTEIVHRWVGKFEDARLDALNDFKRRVETTSSKQSEKRRA